MATVTKTMATFADGLVVFEVDYNNSYNPPRLLALRCRNNSSDAAYGQIVQTSNGRAYDMRFAPGETYIPIPTTTAQRITSNLVEDRLVDLSFQFMHPYP